jgi:hypothetical protein
MMETPFFDFRVLNKHIVDLRIKYSNNSTSLAVSKYKDNFINYNIIYRAEEHYVRVPVLKPFGITCPFLDVGHNFKLETQRMSANKGNSCTRKIPNTYLSYSKVSRMNCNIRRARAAQFYTAAEDMYYAQHHIRLTLEAMVFFFFTLFDEEKVSVLHFQGWEGISMIDIAHYVTRHVQLVCEGRTKTGVYSQPLLDAIFPDHPIISKLRGVRIYDEKYPRVNLFNQVVDSDSDFIIVRKLDRGIEPGPVEGIFCPEKYVYAVFIQPGSSCTKDDFVRSTIGVKFRLSMAYVHSLCILDHGKDDHFNVIANVLMCHDSNFPKMWSVDAYFIKMCSRTLDDYAWNGSLQGYRRDNSTATRISVQCILEYFKQKPVMRTLQTVTLLENCNGLMTNSALLAWHVPNQYDTSPSIEKAHLDLQRFTSARKFGDKPLQKAILSEYNAITGHSFDIVMCPGSIPDGSHGRDQYNKYDLYLELANIGERTVCVCDVPGTYYSGATLMPTLQDTAYVEGLMHRDSVGFRAELVDEEW